MNNYDPRTNQSNSNYLAIVPTSTIKTQPGTTTETSHSHFLSMVEVLVGDSNDKNADAHVWPMAAGCMWKEGGKIFLRVDFVEMSSMSSMVNVIM